MSRIKDFQASLYNVGVFSGYSDGTRIYFTDRSNYDTSAQFQQTEFTYYRKIAVTQPDGTTYLFSSLTDGDTTCIVPNGATLPIIDNYVYETGDGVYTIKLYSVPTYASNITYSLALADCVYYGGKLYRYVPAYNSNNKQPNLYPTIWAEITDYNDLPSIYTSEGNLAVICATELCLTTMVNSAVRLQNCYCTSRYKLCANDSWIKANELIMILDNINDLVDNGDWAGVTALINKARAICCCNN